MHGVDDAHEVDVERVDERLRRQMLAERTDTRVGHHDIEAAQLRDGVGQAHLERCPIPDVHLGRDNPDTGLLDEPRGLVQIRLGRQRVLVGSDVGTDVESDHVGALLRQPNRMTAPLTAGGTGDQDNFPGNSPHDRSLALLQWIPNDIPSERHCWRHLFVL